MNMTFQYDNIIDNDKEEILREIFTLEENQNIEELLNDIAKASFTEYIKMLSGSGMPNRADESKQIRLYYLIQEHYNIIPDDLNISSLFQITITQSKTLIKNTVSRYRVKLKNNILLTIMTLLENKYKEIEEEYNNREDNSLEINDFIREQYGSSGKISFILKSEFIKLDISSEISKIDPSLELFEKQKNSMYTYSLNVDSAIALFIRYGFIHA